MALVGLTACSPEPTAEPASLTPLALSPCESEPDTLCGQHEVWEDRDAAVGRRIALRVVVLPALEPLDGGGPVFWLAGGPGAAASDGVRARRRSTLRRHHDIVLVDQRGTGGSNRLDCPGRGSDSQRFIEGGPGDVPFFEACRSRLEQYADLTQYVTRVAMDDLNEVRQALGYDRINLFGGSYGTRAAQVYMRRHPETVRAVILNGVSPISEPIPLGMAHEAQRAMDNILAACQQDAACSRAFPELSSKLDETLARLEAKPATVRYRDRDVSLTRDGLAQLLHAHMYYMPLARRLPLAIYRAWHGEYDILLQTVGQIDSRVEERIAVGMQMSVICGEDVPQLDDAAAEAEATATLLGVVPTQYLRTICAAWPAVQPAAGLGTPATTDVPVLLWTGRFDPVTGPTSGEAVATHLPRSLHLVVPGAHGVNGPCIGQVSRDFLLAGSLDGLDTSCVNEITLPPFPTGNE